MLIKQMHQGIGNEEAIGSGRAEANKAPAGKARFSKSLGGGK